MCPALRWVGSLCVAGQILACTCPPNHPRPDACSPQPETCDGIDNDCDGVVDRISASEPLMGSCPNQVGTCAGAQVACANGQFPSCGAAEYGTKWQALETKCDGLDNDCDGTVDRLADGGGLLAACRMDAGVCAGKFATCAGGFFPECAGAEYGPLWESIEAKCDGLDNDCDGVVDQSRWVKTDPPYPLSGNGTGSPDPYPFLFVTDAGYVAQYGPRLWSIDRNLVSQPAVTVPDPNGQMGISLFPSAVRIQNEYVVLVMASQPANNFAYRFGLDGRLILEGDGGVAFWSLGSSPGLFTLRAACSDADGEHLLAGSIPGSGQPYLLSIAHDGGTLSSVVPAPGPAASWTCAATAEGYVVALVQSGSTSFFQLDAQLGVVGSARTVSGACSAERIEANGEPFAVCNPPSILRGIFDGGVSVALSTTGVVRAIRTPRETLIASYTDLGFRTQRLEVASAAAPTFKLLQTALSDHHVGVQAGEPGVIILMVDDVPAQSVSYRRLCYP